MIKKQWQGIFRKDIVRKLEVSEQEYRRYKNTGDIIYLQQAGNKLFSVVENFLMLKYQRRTRNYKALFDMVKHNEKDRTILREAAQLHYFFYNGELDMPVFEAEDFYKIVRDKMRRRLKEGLK